MKLRAFFSSLRFSIHSQKVRTMLARCVWSFAPIARRIEPLPCPSRDRLAPEQPVLPKRCYDLPQLFTYVLFSFLSLNLCILNATAVEGSQMNQELPKSFVNPLKAAPRILALSSSLREDSVNHKLLLEAIDYLQTKGIQVKQLRLGDDPIPLYNTDQELSQGAPPAAVRFRQALLDSDWILVASPEHNYSVSAALKNAIDWASRDNGKPSRAAFQGKKWIFLSASPGPEGGANGLKHLGESINGLKGDVFAESFSLPNAYSAFGPNGHLSDPAMRAKLQAYLDRAFAPLKQ